MARSPARAAGLGVALAAGLAAGACNSTGDLGRPRPNLWSDSIAPQMGFEAARSRGEAASPFRMTDDEMQLRDRAWHFIMPADDRNIFERQVSELVYTRILPVQRQSQNISDYFNSLMSGYFRSQASRYARLADDASADRLLIGPFRGNAMRVVAADRVRLRAVSASPLVSPEMQDPAFARVVENEGLILWVCQRVTFRIESYRYALANLVVEVPSREAIRAERAIMALEAEAMPMCKLPLLGVFGGAAAPPPPVEIVPQRPVVYKG